MVKVEFFACLLVLCGAADALLLPNSTLEALRSGGAEAITTAYGEDNAQLTAAYVAFQSINTSCQAIINQTAEACKTCVADKCRQRGEDQCSNFLTDTIQFFGEDLPDFFTSEVPNFFESTIPKTAITIGDGIVDIAEDGISELVKFGNGIPKGLNSAVDEVGSLALDIGKGFEDLGNLIDNHVINPLTDIGQDALNFGEDFLNTLNPANWLFKISIPGLGKRRKRSALRAIVKRQAETTTVTIPTSAPSCDDVQNNAGTACLYYTDSSRCSQCQFDPDSQCDGWTTSVEDIQTAADNREWISDATDLFFLVQSVEYEQAKFTFEGITDTKVTVHLFGKTYSFVLSEPLNIFDTGAAGKLIADTVVKLARAGQ